MDDIDDQLAVADLLGHLLSFLDPLMADPESQDEEDRDRDGDAHGENHERSLGDLRKVLGYFLAGFHDYLSSSSTFVSSAFALNRAVDNRYKEQRGKGRKQEAPDHGAPERRILLAALAEPERLGSRRQCR